eukprot:1137216-Pelagomonas_calceolata.AAC.8
MRTKGLLGSGVVSQMRSDFSRLKPHSSWQKVISNMQASLGGGQTAAATEEVEEEEEEVEEGGGGGGAAAGAFGWSRGLEDSTQVLKSLKRSGTHKVRASAYLVGRSRSSCTSQMPGLHVGREKGREGQEGERHRQQEGDGHDEQDDDAGGVEHARCMHEAVKSVGVISSDAGGVGKDAAVNSMCNNWQCPQ